MATVWLGGSTLHPANTLGQRRYFKLIGICIFDVTGVCLPKCGHSRRTGAELSLGKCLAVLRGLVGDRRLVLPQSEWRRLFSTRPAIARSAKADHLGLMPHQNRLEVPSRRAGCRTSCPWPPA
jgi:hypothetical protein